jgi:hypothetical protein
MPDASLGEKLKNWRLLTEGLKIRIELYPLSLHGQERGAGVSFLIDRDAGTGRIIPDLESSR